MGLHTDIRGEKRGRRFCPLMGEWCVKGWTPKMGNGPDGFPIEGACAAWQPVDVFAMDKNQTILVHDCVQFSWPADLLTEIAKESFQAAASADKIATEVSKHHGTFLAALPGDVRDRVMRTNPRLAPKVTPQLEGPK